MVRTCFYFAFCCFFWSCGSHTQNDAVSRTPPLSLSQYPTDMPQSQVADRRLIGHWITECMPMDSGSALWSFLLDDTKAVLETQIFHDVNCVKPTLLRRSYMTVTADGTTLETKIWQVSTAIYDGSKVAHSQDCELTLLEAGTWYDFTDSRCLLSNLPVVTTRGSTLIHSKYVIDSMWRRLRFEVPGQENLQFTRQDF